MYFSEGKVFSNSKKKLLDIKHVLLVLILIVDS
jgi:hypothetical protein